MSYERTRAVDDLPVDADTAPPVTRRLQAPDGDDGSADELRFAAFGVNLPAADGTWQLVVFPGVPVRRAATHRPAAPWDVPPRMESRDLRGGYSSRTAKGS